MFADCWNSRPKRNFDFSIPNEMHPLDASTRIKTDTEYWSLYPNGSYPPMYVPQPPSLLSFVEPSHKFTTTTELHKRVNLRPGVSTSRPGLVSVLKDTQPATMNPVKRVRLQRPLSSSTKQSTEETPQGYYKRPDGTVYFLTSGQTMFERGSMTGN